MAEKPEPRIGRTYADALVDIFSAWKLVVLVLVALLATFVIVHFSAEPGTLVEYLGLIKYQKARPPSVPVVVPAADELAAYRMPKEARLDLKQNTAIPILDGTLAIQPTQHDLRLVGDNVSEVLLGSRNIDGTPTSQPYRDQGGAVFSPNTYLEIEFRKRHFALEIRELDRYNSVSVTVTPLRKPTLRLQKFSDLKIPSGEN